MPTNVDFVSAVTKIQSCWRAHRTRKHLHEVHTCYADVMESIDGEGPSYPSSVPMKMSVLKRPSLVQGDSWCMNHEETSKNVENIDQVEDTFESDSATSIASEKSHCEYAIPEEHGAESAETLLDAKQHVAMELLWIQIAIESRRNYLQVKQNLADNDKSS